MLTLLPSGMLGLVAASLIAAFMSTMSTQLNLGASYLVNDFYKRFVDKKADELKLVFVGRIFTIISILLGAGLGMVLTSASQAFNLLLMIGAGTGLIYILRWFWWRINAFTEIVAMVSSLIIAFSLSFFNHSLESWQEIVFGALLTTVTWIVATFITPPDDDETLERFVKKVCPGGPGWKKYSPHDTKGKWFLPSGLLCMFFGTVAVYGYLLGVGNLIYGKLSIAFLLIVLALASSYSLYSVWIKNLSHAK